ncbi:MAG: MarR family transcriptional regulator [Nitrospira sp.]|nr:MarR family transcriptional regulator [Nitrospira sp.]
MDKKTALGYIREFLKLYWANEHAHDAWSRKLEAEHGMTAKQYALLRAVERAEDMTTSDLTVLLGKAQPAITQMLNRLEANGFVTREASLADRRKREVKLTKKAYQVLNSVAPVGPTRAALALEHASEREAGDAVKAMETIFKWMTKR